MHSSILLLSQSRVSIDISTYCLYMLFLVWAVFVLSSSWVQNKKLGCQDVLHGWIVRGWNLYKGLDYLEFGILNIPYLVGTYVQTTLPTLLVFDSAHYFKIKASRNKSTLTSSIYVPIRFYFKTI